MHDIQLHDQKLTFVIESYGMTQDVHMLFVQTVVHILEKDKARLKQTILTPES